MKRNEKNLDEVLDRHLGLFKASKQADAEKETALNRLQSHTADAIGELSSVAPTRGLWPYMLAAAAVLVAGVLTIGTLRSPRIDAHAIVQSADGSLSRVSDEKTQVLRAGERIEAGEVLRANNSGARIMLADTSRVELRAQSEFSLERAEDGVRIRLVKGGLIINAAPQHAGHLYVHTKDVTVSVVGTVFLVNAEEAGSRVAVLEGEVRVQHGATEKNLLPGEQLSTIPSTERLQVTEGIAWSPRAPEHIALMQRSAVASAPAAPARLDFAVASIKPIPAHTTIPGTAGGLRGSGLGLACRGTDGLQRVLLTVTHAGQAGVTAPLGRCVGRGIFLSTLIELAYGIQARYVSGGPDWARSRPFATLNEAGRGADIIGGTLYGGADGFQWRPDPDEFFTGDSFQIEATADNPSTTTLAQLKQMLQTMLADRFNLKSSRASTVVPGYALILGGKGSKLKPILEEYEESLVLHGGKSTVEKLAQTLSRAINVPVVDKTGLTGAFEYELRRYDPVGGVMPGRMGGGPLSEAEAAELLSLRLEDQLGLRLVPEKAVPAEIFVIESVELPTPN
jgi:uncharacterized protein (TIGR03435 family)